METANKDMGMVTVSQPSKTTQRCQEALSAAGVRKQQQKQLKKL